MRKAVIWDVCVGMGKNATAIEEKIRAVSGASGRQLDSRLSLPCNWSGRIACQMLCGRPIPTCPGRKFLCFSFHAAPSSLPPGAKIIQLFETEGCDTYAGTIVFLGVSL